jgi:organic hydroperoxide reductase OsmC/OhrA
MKISAALDNAESRHTVTLRTDGREHSLVIAPKPDGLGSSVNGGELLFLALATCFCNDLYREARKRGINIQRVHVEVSGEFAGEGEPASNIAYRAAIEARAPQQDILDLMRHTDTVAEIQNTLRGGSAVILSESIAHEV